MAIFGRYINVTLISLFILALGVIALLMSQVLVDSHASPRLLTEMLRDIGIALCSTGLISTAYEVLIRNQLLDDHARRIQAILDDHEKQLETFLEDHEERIGNKVNPDFGRLGILRIFGSRDDRASQGLSTIDMFNVATSEIMIYAASLSELLTTRRKLLIEFIVRKRGTVKLLISNMAGSNLPALDDTLSVLRGSLIEDIESGAAALKTLRNALRAGATDGDRPEDRLIVKCHNVVPPFSLVSIDPALPHGIFLVELNGVRIADSDHPSFRLERRDGGLYALYERQLNQLWDSADDCDETPRTTKNSLIGGLELGLQEELHRRIEVLRRERVITNVVYYHYSASFIQAEVTKLLHEGVKVELYLQSPQTAVDMRLEDQAGRIGATVALLRQLDVRSKSRLTLWQSAVPHTVRAAVFGEEFIVLGWYVYHVIQTASPPAIVVPMHGVKGHPSFGVLIERSHPAFVNAQTFLESYRDGLGATQVAV